METDSSCLLGVSCHLGVYGVVGCVPVLRCLFLELGTSEPQLRSLLLRGERLSDSEARVLGRFTYASLAVGATEAEERRVALNRRSALLAKTFNSSSAARMLSRLFTVVRVQLDGQRVEVLAVEAAFSSENRRRLEEVLSLYHVAKLVVIGSYPSEPYGPGSSLKKDPGEDSRETLVEYGTHANKKFKRGYCASDLALSFRVGARKYVWEQSDCESVRLEDLFQVSDVRFLRTDMRLVTPRNFVAVAVTDEQCFVLLKTAWRWIYDLCFSGFHGMRPLFDYLGPDLYDQGGPRSMFFPGFPGLSVYAVEGLSVLLKETAIDAMGEIVSCCGLPDIVGTVGKFSVCLRSDVPVLVPPEDLSVFSGENKPLRINGTSFSVRSRDDFQCYLHLKPAPLHRFTLQGLIEGVLARCVRVEDLDTDFPYNHRITRDEVCCRFLENLRHQALDAFLHIQSLLGYLLQHLTSACTSAGLEWVMVKHHREVYAYDNLAAHCAMVSAEVCVRTVLSCYWRKLFGDLAVDEFRCVHTDSAPGILVLLEEQQQRVVGAFHRSGEMTWLDVVGQVLTRVLDLTVSSDASHVRDLYREVLFRFVSYRNDVSFWVSTYYPGDVVRAHVGVIDCAPFPGVLSLQGEVLVQSRDAALETDIGYGRYLKQAFSILGFCVNLQLERQAQISGGSALLTEDMVEEIGSTVLTDGLHFFQLNN
ncbi:helicase-primase subunit [Saimiriine betaherpesvirus 4]|uniref:Helicase-primase subunit n=1 Tax=Saimiriine betaherpesvirus 4 TaxID=1535247 RepID=G8XT05_9BETA|nr:helicase-primase subunit [Saimiriine betaherpesvirus 4]AEV80951.1 helicase-primase subunit [Saimiriine betaherpesvirus 4]